MVEDGMDGFTRGRKLDKIGQKSADTAELNLRLLPPHDQPAG
jgi:alkylation response protein AidB-like acyl-CoA dehydrogenase